MGRLPAGADTARLRLARDSERPYLRATRARPRDGTVHFRVKMRRRRLKIPLARLREREG
jgi:hypothetical protein